MATSIFTEDTYEQALIELFQSLEGKQYRYAYGPDIERDYSNPLLDDVLQESLLRINPALPVSAIDDAIKKLHQIEGSSLYECNFKFTQMLQNGIEVTFSGKERQRNTRLLTTTRVWFVKTSPTMAVRMSTWKHNRGRRQG